MLHNYTPFSEIKKIFFYFSGHSVTVYKRNKKTPAYSEGFDCVLNTEKRKYLTNIGELPFCQLFSPFLYFLFFNIKMFKRPVIMMLQGSYFKFL